MRTCLMLLVACLAGCGGSSSSAGAPALHGITITPTPFSTGIGIARKLTATGTYSDLSTAIITSSVTWQSLDSSVATVTDGVVTGVALGSTTVSASLGAVSANLTVNVTANAWSQCASMERATVVTAAALLQNGKVLVVGLDESASTPAVGAELYDPSADAWSRTGPMLVPIRVSPTSTLLADGRVLVAGGAAQGGGGFVFSSAEIYKPSTNSWSATPDMPAGGGYTKNAAALLPNGRVLIAGGASPDEMDTYNAAELYDPVANAWATTANMSRVRFDFTLTLLQNGKVLAAGGMTPTYPGPVGFLPAPTASAETYDPTARSWTPVSPMNLPRSGHVATLLSNGDVLVISGDISSSATEIYHPSTNTWTEVGNLEIPRTAFTATRLPDGRVIVAGGASGSTALSETELFDPVAGTWSPAASMETAREEHGATLLQNSALLVAGGQASSTASASCELYW